MRLTFTDNGPILIEADGPVVTRRGGQEQAVEGLRIMLCRCGHSETKPYCDGTHRRAGFLAPPDEIEISSTSP